MYLKLKPNTPRDQLNMATQMQPDINIGPSAVIAGWIEAGIAIIVVTARTYTQAKVVGRMGIEDYIMIAALVGSILPVSLSGSDFLQIVAMLNTSLITHAVSWGIGRHIYYLTPDETINAIKFEFIAQVSCEAPQASFGSFRTTDRSDFG